MFIKCALLIKKGKSSCSDSFPPLDYLYSIYIVEKVKALAWLNIVLEDFADKKCSVYN
jgi:hypothetical protein